ncbi:MAG: hypothetical protein R3Y04_08105 [Rikenellaceae bacterium]
MNITILFPTKSEAKYFERSDVKVKFCGVGLIASAYGTYKAIADTKPDMIIMAGIAGVYKGIDLEIGQSVIVEREYQADLGLFYKEGFRHLSDDTLDMDFEVLNHFDCPYAKQQKEFRTAVSNSMNCGLAPFVKSDGVDIENMEGASFFYICNKECVKFLELRTISNVVDPAHDDWDYEGSIRNLTASLHKLIDSLKSNS